MADSRTFGGQRARVLGGMVRNFVAHTSHEVDVVVLDNDSRVLGIGEAKWGKRMNLGHLARLQGIADVLDSRDQRSRVLAMFSGAGFAPDLVEVAATSGGRVHRVIATRAYLPTESPQVRVSSDVSPQESHGRNGITRHKTARLLAWLLSVLTSLYAGSAGLTSLTAQAFPVHDRPSVNRQVIVGPWRVTGVSGGAAA